MKFTIEQLLDQKSLTQEEAREVMVKIMSGEYDDAKIAGFLIALRAKGEKSEEIAGFAQAMREKMTSIPISSDAIDMCGTGGDASGTFNISTAASFVVAGAGVKVAKHGNRSMTSRSGSADVLEALGVDITLSPEKVAKCIETIGLGFMFAPSLHPAMKYAMGARNSLAVRTVFNILGPLTNPANATAHLIGVADPIYGEVMAKVLAELGSTRALIVHGMDGLDELSISGETQIWEMESGSVTSYTITPEDLGLNRSSLKALEARNADESIQILRSVLQGEEGPPRDVVLMNSGAALMAANHVNCLKDGIQMAAESIDCGKALRTLENIVRLSNELE